VILSLSAETVGGAQLNYDHGHQAASEEIQKKDIEKHNAKREKKPETRGSTSTESRGMMGSRVRPVAQTPHHQASQPDQRVCAYPERSLFS
jgi:hypothetical protein